MGKMNTLCVALYIFGLILCAASEDKPSLRVMGGNEAEPHSHPYLVSLRHRFIIMKLGHFCGGSLISENWVLTAGHCMSSFVTKWMSVDVVAGGHYIDRFEQEVQRQTVERRLIYPTYNGDIEPNDIAILKTAGAFSFNNYIKPIALPSKGFEIEDSNKMATLAGWGIYKSTFFIPRLPDALQEVQLPLISYKDCYKAFNELFPEENNHLDQQSNICTGPLTGEATACSGDSGGPLVYYQHNNHTDVDDDKPVLIGIVSWGTWPCGIVGAANVYTKVSNFIDFITSSMDNN